MTNNNVDCLFQVRGDRVLLRDLRADDVEQRIRWVTVEMAWQQWDAPWEGVTRVSADRTDERKHEYLRGMTEPLPTPRDQLWIERIGGPLLGWVSQGPDESDPSAIWVGINICESAFWNKGLGTEALQLWVDYLFANLVGLDSARLVFDVTSSWEPGRGTTG